MDINFIYEIPKKSFDFVPWISLIVSIWSLVKSIKVTEKSKRQNLNAVYFNSIFDEFLITHIPESLEKIQHIEDKFVEENDALEDILIELLRKIIFFKYKNEMFYTELKNKIVEIDEFLVTNNNLECDTEGFNAKKNELEKSVKKLYEIIEIEYCK